MKGGKFDNQELVQQHIDNLNINPINYKTENKANYQYNNDNGFFKSMFQPNEKQDDVLNSTQESTEIEKTNDDSFTIEKPIEEVFNLYDLKNTLKYLKNTGNEYKLSYYFFKLNENDKRYYLSDEDISDCDELAKRITYLIFRANDINAYESLTLRRGFITQAINLLVMNKNNDTEHKVARYMMPYIKYTLKNMKEERMNMRKVEIIPGGFFYNNSFET